MKKWYLRPLFFLWPLLGFAQEMIERIDIVGNERVTRETVMYYLTAREGDYYSDELLKKDFRGPLVDGIFFEYPDRGRNRAPREKSSRYILTENPVIKEHSL